jgi:hypothetical protein
MPKMAHNEGSQQFRPQLCPRSRAASLYYIAVLPAFRSRIPGFGLDSNVTSTIIIERRIDSLSTIASTGQASWQKPQ